MPTCNFFSSTNHYQSHVQSFGKVLEIFLNFFGDSVDFISIILQGGVNLVYWDFIGFCYESRCARIGKDKEIILQANG